MSTIKIGRRAPYLSELSGPVSYEELAEALDILTALANGRGGKALRQRAQKLVAKFVEREILK